MSDVINQGEPERRLLAAVAAAHYASAFRDNPSTVALSLAWQASGDFGKALTAALSTLGGKHAPLRETYELLSGDDPETAARAMVLHGDKVPGWGTSFKDATLWQVVAELIRAEFPARWAVLRDITDMLRFHGKQIYPNPSAYTATAALIAGLPPAGAVWLFTAGRLEAWLRIAMNGGDWKQGGI